MNKRAKQVDPTQNAHIIIVSGRPGAGKSTLARRIADAFGCPLISRDEIYEGIRASCFFSKTSFVDKSVSRETFKIFFSAVRIMYVNGVLCVAEAAFQDKKWKKGLESLSNELSATHIHCEIDLDSARTRIQERRATRFNALSSLAPLDGFLTRTPYTGGGAHRTLSLGCPTLHVRAVDGYTPSFEQILSFIVKHYSASSTIAETKKKYWPSILGAR